MTDEQQIIEIAKLMPTEIELKLFLAGCLADKICQRPTPIVGGINFCWLNNEVYFDGDEQDEMLPIVRDTEWLHICWLVEQSLDMGRYYKFEKSVKDLIYSKDDWNGRFVSLDWQQRASVLKQVMRDERELSTLQAEVVELKRTNQALLAHFQHYHVNNGIDDTCKECGFDLRHEIHFRAKEKQP